MKVREQFSRLLEDDKIIIAPGCYDAVSAKIIENLGFKCAYLGGYTIGATLGTTEPLTTLGETVRFASYITSRINIPPHRRWRCRLRRRDSYYESSTRV